MTALLDSLRFVCISHLTLYVVFLLLHYRRVNSARYAAAFCVGVIGYLLFPFCRRLGASDWLLLILTLIMSVQAFCFWMVALSFFREDFRSRWYHWLILFLRVACSFVVIGVFPDADHLDPIDEFLRSLPIVVFSVGLAGLGLWEALREFSADLIESRRRLRVWYLAAGGGAIVFVALFRLGMTGPDLREVHELATMSIILVLIYAFFLSGVELRGALIATGRIPDAGTTAPEQDSRSSGSDVTTRPKIDPELARKLTAAFETERVYRQEGLTIRQLARHLDTHEYRLRRLINAGLGYRNFNDFLNRYRVQEACEILLDPAQARLPIVRISDELGYRSLGSFNKAFRELTGQTPSDFRRTHETLRNG